MEKGKPYFPKNSHENYLKMPVSWAFCANVIRGRTFLSDPLSFFTAILITEAISIRKIIYNSSLTSVTWRNR